MQGKDSKKEFMMWEVATLSINGAFQRSGIYKSNENANVRGKFHAFLRYHLEKLVLKYKKGNISDKEHIDNIQTLVKEAVDQYNEILRDGRFRIGIAQKLLNLYLKYLWCMGGIATPPHCPFDSIVCSHIKNIKVPSFTKLDSINEYSRLVDAARIVAKNVTLAEWELEIWNKEIHARKGTN